MGLALFRYTPSKIEDSLQPKREMLHLWAAAWTIKIAEAADGLDVLQRQEVYRIVHEIRKRVEAGDFGPPLALPGPRPRGQQAMMFEGVSSA